VGSVLDILQHITHQSTEFVSRGWYQTAAFDQLRTKVGMHTFPGSTCGASIVASGKVLADIIEVLPGNAAKAFRANWYATNGQSEYTHP